MTLRFRRQLVFVQDSMRPSTSEGAQCSDFVWYDFLVVRQKTF